MYEIKLNKMIDDFKGKSENYVSPKAEMVARKFEALNISTNPTSYAVGQEGIIPQEDISKVVDFDRISISADDAANGIYVKVNQKYWGDQSNLTYKIINDKCVALISEDGSPLGYTSLNALNLENVDNFSENKYNFSPNSLADETREINKRRAMYGDKRQIEKNTEEAYDPHEDLTVSSNPENTMTTINGEATERRKVKYTDQELYYMAQLVENEAGNSGITGQVAVAEEIRNRVVSDNPYFKDTVEGVLDQGYAPWAGNFHSIKPSAETLDICKKVLDGELWVFGRDDVLSHASHSGTNIYQTQKGIDGSQSYASFYYGDLDRTQTFYTLGDPTEESRRV